MRAYLNILENILEKGTWKSNRTGVESLSIVGSYFEHDMANGFPLITTKKMPFKTIATELEFFIKGYTDKAWLQERGCKIWDEWCTPAKVPYGHDEKTRDKMRKERDLGPIYGWQWRHFGARYEGYDKDYSGKGVDQLANLIDKLNADPSDRRMIVSAWNPQDLHSMALPACHYSFQVLVANDKLSLIWQQRSVDSVLGLPFNIASYGLLLHLLARQVGLAEGKLVGQLADTHIYSNQIEGVKQQLRREPRPLPAVHTRGSNLFEWTHTDSKIERYDPHPKMKFELAI